MQAFYRTVYPKSWHLVKHNLLLLIFGCFASILGFHELKILFNLNQTTPDFMGSIMTYWISFFDIFISTDITRQNLSGFLGLLGLFIVMAIVVILAVSSQGALIHIAGQKNGKRRDLKEAMQMGLEKFWPLFGLTIINTLVGYFFVALIIDPLIYFSTFDANTPFLGFLVTTLAFFILIPIVIIISFITRYGACYIVLKHEKMLNAFTYAWRLFRANWLITVENALAILGVTVIYFALQITILVFAFTPFLILAYLLASASLTFSILIIIFGSLIAVAIFLFTTSLYGVYYNIVWTNTFLHLLAPGKSYSKVHRLALQHMPKLAK